MRTRSHSDTDTTPWLQVQGGDENSNELHGLVEDKEIAARAVAFVVNNTRKGIVPLCADVATLLRGRRSLEKKVARLRAENHSLRSRFSSTQTSISTSPAPTSIHSCSERGLCIHDHSSLPQDKCSTCSRCSSRSSSLTSNSPKLDKVPSNQRLPRFHRTSAFTIPASSSLLSNPTHELNGDGVFQAAAVVHPSPVGGTILPSKEHQRKDSLPQIVCEPDGDVQKVRPRISVAVQCTLDIAANSVLQERFQDALKENTKLTAQLTDAHNEITKLKERLKELEMTDTLTQQHVQKQRSVDSEFYHLENECESLQTVPSSASRVVNTSTTQPTSSAQQNCSLSTSENGVSTPVAGPLEDQAMTSVAGPREGHDMTSTNGPLDGEAVTPVARPLEGCRCTTCSQEMLGKHEEIQLSNLLRASGVDVEMGSLVVLAGDRTGHVCYIGHLDHSATANTLYANRANTQVGQHSGSVDGKQYFSCEKDCGIFVPLQDIQHVINSKPPAVKSQPAERSPAPSSTVACKPPVLLRRDHHLHSQRLVNEKHFVTMAHVNGRPLTKSVITGHHEQIV
ncbi:hypothetical protein NP493_227g03013 [Ridgeia piscesae]|uniref:CAP-Gly domain-containing protein n=1 Tax=Ridgeia piscesae TaxID=27915 RepID=A0AAD9P021_RIDPI|nr:hypothetical protein NP493_227g03013 [Ridgeia piscesae]